MRTLLLIPILLLFSVANPVSAAERRAQSRQAHCRVDNREIEDCRFTPVDGDGSFIIEAASIDKVRLTIFEGVATLSLPMGPRTEIPMMGTYHRDRLDRACWVTDLPRDLKIAGPPQRICVYR